ncbi:MAG: hypothetical protein ACI4XA_08880 [Oscillospiraceae bacterium]
MNKKGKRALLAATVFVASLNMNGCGVYGPPPDDLLVSVDPNQNECVYGPPEYFEEIRDASEGEKEAVDNEIFALLSSDDYKVLDADGKRERVLELMRRLAAEGTEEYPYPLIGEYSAPDSGDKVFFAYNDGSAGEVPLSENGSGGKTDE